jgi:hypothetical protein
MRAKLISNGKDLADVEIAYEAWPNGVWRGTFPLPARPLRLLGESVTLLLRDGRRLHVLVGPIVKGARVRELRASREPSRSAGKVQSLNQLFPFALPCSTKGGLFSALAKALGVSARELLR